MCAFADRMFEDGTASNADVAWVSRVDSWEFFWGVACENVGIRVGFVGMRVGFVGARVWIRGDACGIRGSSRGKMFEAVPSSNATETLEFVVCRMCVFVSACAYSRVRLYMCAYVSPCFVCARMRHGV